jgi:glutamine synthetase
VEYSFHEDAPSQHEIDLRHTDALTMADSVMTFRLVVKEVAASQGVHATFMPKPLESVQGSGMHVHLSLFDGDENAFYAPTTRTTCRRSPSTSWPAAAPRREITAITNQTVNSYKRLVPGVRGAGAHQLGAQQPQRLGACAHHQARQPSATRIEFRSPIRHAIRISHSRSCSPAGMRGITEEYELPPGGRQQPVRDERGGARQARSSTCCRSRSAFACA